jgi:HEPN domain-containing protein
MSIEDRLALLDEELRKTGVRIALRPLACFKSLHGSVKEPKRRIELFGPINAWYANTYRDESVWDGVVASFPVLVRGEIYSSDVNLIKTGAPIDYKSVIKGLPQHIADVLTPEEFRSITGRLQQANTNWRFLYNLSVDDSMLNKQSRDLIARATHDLENVGLILPQLKDVQSALVGAHEAAEKFLKAALVYAGYTGNLISLGHDIQKVFKTLTQMDSRYSSIPKPTTALKTYVPNMRIRYEATKWSVEDAVSAYHSALYICGTLALIWVLDQERGGKDSNFKAGRFYDNSAIGKGHCMSADASAAVLLCFKNIEGCALRYELEISQRDSALWLEVKNTTENERLRQELQWYLRNCNNKISPAQAGIVITDDKEGAFTTGVLRVRRNRPKNL